MVCEGLEDNDTPILLGDYGWLQQGIGSLIDNAERVIKRQTLVVAFYEELNHDLAICAAAFFSEAIFIDFLRYYLEIIKHKTPDEVKQQLLKTLSIKRKIEESYPELFHEELKQTASLGGFERYLEKWLHVLKFRNGVAHNWVFEGHDLYGRFVNPSHRGDIKYLFKRALRRDGGIRKLNKKLRACKLEDLETARFVTDNAIKFFIYLWNRWIKPNGQTARRVGTA